MIESQKRPANRRRTDSSGQSSDPSMAVIPDIREDEEQAMKMQEIINLLVAGGYFRARIKGLNNFDKIIGGMSWAIEMSNHDLDVDILFQESLTIGQKIALTEKIVRVLQLMSCPHKIEPHQIQGMDCIHIFPVIQWLVKKSIETRQQMSEYIKSYANWLFNRSHSLNTDNDGQSSQSMTPIDENKYPKRKYRHPARHKLTDPDIRVRTTLLEYGVMTKTGANDGSHSSAGIDETTGQSVGRKNSDLRMTESLMSSMTSESGKISAAFVGSIVGAQSDEIQKLAEEYYKKKLEREESSIERKERELRSRVEAAKKELSSIKQNESEIREKVELIQQKIDFVKEKQQSFEPNDSQTDEEREEKQNLCLILDSLKKQKSEFKQFCREEKQRLEKQIEELSNQTTDTEDETEVETEVQSYDERHSKLKTQLAELNQSVAKMQRKFDDIPTRAELSQYQKRFIELYNQVAAKHNETKKFYTLYNTLDDERMYLEKELNLIGSIVDNFHQAQNSNTSLKDQYLLQFDQIVENIKQTKLKVENRRLQEKAKKDVLNDTYLELIEKQRLYYKGVKDFKEECKTNERLISELENRKQKPNSN